MADPTSPDRHSAVLHHTSGMALTVEIEGHSFIIDAKPEHGGTDQGPTPKPLLLASLAGCTSMDVISMLTKMRQTWTRMDVSATAVLTDEHPRVYRDIVVTFDVEGDVDPGRLARAVGLSRDRYCGVSAMIEAHAPVTVKIMLNGEEQPSPPKA